MTLTYIAYVGKNVLLSTEDCLFDLNFVKFPIDSDWVKFPTDSDWMKFPTDSDWMKKSLQVLLINDAMTQRKNCYFSSTIKATLIVTSESNALISNRQNFRVNEGTNRSVALRDVPS
jgi:hypothetical protein